MTDALSGLLMGVPEPSFGAHMLTEDILMASSRGTAGRSSIQSITHHRAGTDSRTGSISYQEKVTEMHNADPVVSIKRTQRGEKSQN